ncbi:MAG: UbiA family prenyltransferase [Xenococcaceae cyanobacterium MO_188.B32]|nr:UbiA family prenyltransferase [Xenococcaceae cyanobacterium MO_188.B32]
MSRPLSIKRLHLLLSLFRFRFHHNFLAVIFGAVLFTPITLETLLGLTVQYFCFALCLYGGIYSINSLSDMKLDAQHPQKCYRPLPSGQLFPGEVIPVIVLLWGLAFGLVALWDGSLRFWPIYIAFIAVNLIYSLWLRRSGWRWIIGITLPMRLHLGAMLVDIILPWDIYVLGGLFMATVQCLKFRLEARASATWSKDANERPMELLFTIAMILLVVRLVWEPIETGHCLFLLIVLISFVIFVIFPWVEPGLGVVLGAQLPYTPKQALWPRLVTMLWKLRKWKSLLLLVTFSSVTAINHILMGIEELVIPRLRTMPLNRIHFLIGSQHIGISDLHQFLNGHPSIQFTTMFDLCCPSLLLKWIFRPLRPLFSMIKRHHNDIFNHRITFEEEIGEHLWLLHRCKTNAVSMLFPAIHDPMLEGFYKNLVNYEEEFVAACKEHFMIRLSIAFMRYEEEFAMSSSYEIIFPNVNL